MDDYRTTDGTFFKDMLEKEREILESLGVEDAIGDSVDLNAELKKGYEDMIAGRTRPAKEVFEDIRKDYYG